jgi:AraC-like DNA-binding protein
MSLLIDTRAVKADDRPGFWANELSDVYSPLRVTIGGHEGFQARMWGESLASVGLFRIAASAHSITRTRADVDANDPHSVYLSVLLKGHLKGSQHGRDFELGPGDIAAHDSSYPSSRWADEPFDLLVLRVPKTMLGTHAARVERLTAVRLPGGTGLPRLAGRFFCGTAAGLADGSISTDDLALADIVADLVRRLYDDVDVALGGRPRSRAEIYAHALSFIEDHLGDPELDPEQVARACHVSKRYLYGMFAANGHSVCDLIRTARLEHCRQDLLDPRCSDEPISTVATRWGLPSPSHFSRLFRAVYGCSPRELRRTRTLPVGR